MRYSYESGLTPIDLARPSHALPKTFPMSSAEPELVTPPLRRGFEEQIFPFWKTLWKYFADSRWWILVAIGFNVIAGMAITVQNAFPKFLTDNILLAQKSPSEKVIAALWLTLAFILVTVFGRVLCWHLSMRIFTKITARTLARIRTLFFSHVHFLCMRFHQQKPSGELLSYLFGSPLVGSQQFLSQFILSVPYSVFTLLSTLVLVTTWNPIMAGILLAALIINGWIAKRAMFRVRLLNHAYQDLESNVSGRASELLRGQKAVKMMGAEANILERFRQDAESIGNKNYEVQVKSHLELIKSEILQAHFYAGLALAGTFLFIQNQITLGELIATLTSYASAQPLVAILFNCALAQGVAHAGLNRIESVLHHSTSTPAQSGPVQTIPPRPEISLKDVYFAYEEASVLNGVSLTIPYGQKVALVGASGSGKSTIISLILRLYDPNRGKVSLGGKDLRAFDLSDVRRQFGVVPQETFLFHISIKENILLANPEATDSQIIEALRRANAWEFVQTLPDGIDTILGENGATLSGGQRQRVGIARALVQNPAIFVFDEATSALDTTAEKVITETLTKILGGHTALIVAHRLSTIRFCDRVIVFEKGRIAQDGSYYELSNEPGPFQELLAAQEFSAGPTRVPL